MLRGGHAVWNWLRRLVSSLTVYPAGYCSSLVLCWLATEIGKERMRAPRASVSIFGAPGKAGSDGSACAAWWDCDWGCEFCGCASFFVGGGWSIYAVVCCNCGVVYLPAPCDWCKRVPVDVLCGGDTCGWIGRGGSPERAWSIVRTVMFRGTPERERVSGDFREHARSVRRNYDRSHCQQMALSQLTIDCAWESGCGCGDFEEDKFVAALLEMVMVYGYAMFQRSKGGMLPEIADGDQFFIARVGGEWHPFPYDDASKRCLRGGGWHLVVVQPPRSERRVSGRGGQWVTTGLLSASARAEIHSRTLDELVLYRRQRNMFNSQPTMFMAEPKAARKLTGETAWQSIYAPEPHHHDSNTTSDMLPIGSASDFTSLLQDRLARTRATREHDARVTSDQDRGGNPPGSLPVVPGGLAPARAPGHQAHAELQLSSGLDYTGSRHLDGDQHEAWVTRDLMFSVFDSWQVPPGKWGLNRNTERMAGNLIISQQPIYIYRSYVTRLLTVFTAALHVCGSPTVLVATPDPSFVSTLVPYLEPEIAAKMMDAAYKLPAGSFSAARIGDAGEKEGGHEAKTPTERAGAKLTDGVKG